MKKITQFIDKIDRHEVFIMSAALAYTTSLALAPFILIILSLLSFLSFDMQEKVTLQIGYALGPEVQSAVYAVVQNLNNHSKLSGISGAIGFVIFVISAFLSIVSLLVTTFITMLYPSDQVLFWQAVAQIVNFLLFTFCFYFYRNLPFRSRGTS